MTPDDLAAVKARVLAWPRPCGVCMGHSPERDGHDKGCDVPIIREDVPALIAALRQAWAVLGAAQVVRDDLVRQRDLAQITMAEDAGRRIMDLTAEVERLGATVARVRARCEYVDILDASEYDAGRMAALDAVLAALDGGESEALF